MNLILFETEEIAQPLRRTDRRATHLLEVLKRQPGETFDAGLIDGPLGKGTVLRVDAEKIHFAFVATAEPPPLSPITLLVGLPRPQTARKILQESTAMGVAFLHFVRTEKGEPSYASSTLWHSGEWRRHLIAGAEQAFCTRLPKISHGKRLQDCLSDLPTGSMHIALDNYEAPMALASVPLDGSRVVLALGGERGWAGAERQALRDRGFIFAHLGRRVLRVETACLAAIALVRARSGFE